MRAWDNYGHYSEESDSDNSFDFNGYPCIAGCGRSMNEFRYRRVGSRRGVPVAGTWAGNAIGEGSAWLGIAAQAVHLRL
jgi:hypothetical protein